MTHSTLPTSGVVLFRLNAEMSCAASRMRNAPMKLNCIVPRQRNQRGMASTKNAKMNATSTPHSVYCASGVSAPFSAGCAKVPRATCTCAAKVKSRMIVPTTPPKIMTPLQKPSTGAKIRSFKCGLPSFLSSLYVP